MMMLKLKLKTVVNAACEFVKLRAAVSHDLAYLGENDTHILKISSARVIPYGECKQAGRDPRSDADKYIASSCVQALKVSH